ncbi:hypothetical protein C1O63_1094 [Dehalococcoides mccartyi]|nr:hypothetical protein C1O63_1094 [Dehalococcoides mccartyi]
MFSLLKFIKGIKGINGIRIFQIIFEILYKSAIISGVPEQSHK